MRSRQLYVIAILIGVYAGLIACAPKAAPPSTPAAFSVAPTATPSVTRVPTADEAVWAKVVSEARKEGKLTAYDYHMPGDIGTAMKEGFSKSTGLDIDIINGSGSVQIERIKAERRAGFLVPSILTTSSIGLYQAKTEGLTQALGVFPELQDKQAWLEYPVVDEEGHILGSSTSFESPWVNTNLVKPGEEPKSWRDLLDPKWKGKISLSDPDSSSSPVVIYNALREKTTALDDQYFKDLGKIVVFMPNTRLEAGDLARGQFAIVFAQTASTMGPSLKAGAPVRNIDMKEGIPVHRSSGVSLLRGAPQPNAARVFLNWWFSREGQLIYAKAAGLQSLRRDVPNFLPPGGQLSPSRPLALSAKDEVETARLQRERVLKKLLTDH